LRHAPASQGRLNALDPLEQAMGERSWATDARLRERSATFHDPGSGNEQGGLGMPGVVQYRTKLMLSFARRLPVGFAGFGAGLIALILACVSLGAEGVMRGEGRIAFSFGESSAVHVSQLALINGDGKNRHVLPLDHVFGVSWSPNGRVLAFSSWYDTFTLNVDGRTKARLVVRGGTNPDWSPSGRSIAFERGHDIWVVNLNDRRQRRIVRHGTSPDWSSDGRKLVFVRDRRVRCPSQQACRDDPSLASTDDIWVIDLATNQERQLVSGGDTPVWSEGRAASSSDGRIAFDRCRRISGIGLACFIYVMRSDGTNQRRLFEGQSPVWSPNRQQLAFIGYDARHHYVDAVMRARLDGSGRRVLFGLRPYCGCGALDWGR
jgi:Tol biopolymer transport system component